MRDRDVCRWRARTILRKFRAGEAAPYEVLTGEGNLALREGIQELFKLLVGDAATAFSNANARIGVGNSSTAAADTQTDLLGANKTYKAMDDTYPQVGAPADKKVAFKATFGSADANHAWNEWVVDNGSGAGKTLNRKVQAFGTKQSGTSWELTVEISLA